MRKIILFVCLACSLLSVYGQDSLLTYGQVYDFEEKDEFHYLKTIHTRGGDIQHIKKNIITEKIETEDSLIYKVSVEERDQVSYLYLKFSKSSLNEKIINSGKVGISLGYNGRIVNSVGGSCCGPDNTEPTSYSTKYAEELGVVSSSSTEIGGAESEELKYFKKGNETYGNLITLSLLEGQEVKGNRSTVYPNPFSSEIFLTMDKDAAVSQEMTVRITNTEGQKVFEFIGSGSKFQRFSGLDNLPEGLYVLAVSNGEQTEYFKLVK